MSQRKTGLTLRIFTVLAFGFFGVAVNLIDASPLIFLFSLQVMGVAVFFPLVLIKGDNKISKKSLVFVLGFTISVLLGDFFFFAAAQKIPVAQAIFLRYTFPLFILFFAVIFFKKPFQRNALFAVALGLIGLGTILFHSGLEEFGLLGAGMALVGACFTALFVLFVKELDNESRHKLLAYRYAIATIILLPIVSLSSAIPFGNTQVLMGLMAFGFFFGVFVTFIDFEAFGRISEHEIGILGYLEPLAATVYAALLLEQGISIWTAVGGVFIIASGIMIVFKGKRDS